MGVVKFPGDCSGVRLLRATIHDGIEFTPRPGGVPESEPVQCLETGRALPELVYVVIRAGVSNEQAAEVLLRLAAYMRDGAPSVSSAPSDSSLEDGEGFPC